MKKEKSALDFRKLLCTPEYDFIHTHPRLGSRIMLLGVSGSYGYGTNREGSDIDFRGVTLNLPSDLIGLTTFDQYEDSATDTVIYSFNKLITLLLGCNPNTIEILGLDDDQYVIKTELGQELLDHRSLFLSKRAAASFGHFADAQLRRLQNATARDTLRQSAREEHILRSVNRVLNDFNRRYAGRSLTDFPEGGPANFPEQSRAEHICDAFKANTRLYIDKARNEGLETEIFMDVSLSHYPLRNFNDLINSLISVTRDYDKVGKRNHKKDDSHLNKHAMHLVRLFMMGIDILEKAEIRTHRPEEDLRLLRSIREGKYMKDSALTPEFYEIVGEYENRFHEAERNSILPEHPDMEQVERFVEAVNRRVVMG